MSCTLVPRLIALGLVVLIAAACSSAAAQRFVIEDEEGDVSPGYLDIVHAVVEFHSDEILVEITVAEDFPSRADAVAWQATLFTPERRYGIEIHLVGTEWRSFVVRSLLPGEPAETTSRGFDMTPPTDRTLRVAVPGELIEVEDPANVMIEVSSSGAEGIVDVAS